MKRPLIAVVMILAGAGVFGSMRQVTRQLQIQASAEHAAVQARRADLDDKRRELEGTRAKLDEWRQRARELPTPDRRVGEVGAALSAITAGRGQPTASQAERLLAELGFNWATTGPYLVVSKSTLRNISLEGMRGASPTDAACGVLAITPSERAAIAAAAGAAEAQFKSWAAQHTTRTGPEGRVLFAYEISLPTDFASTVKDSFSAAVVGALGEERGGLFLDYASDWMGSLGMFGSGTARLAVEQPAGSIHRPLYTIKTGRSTLTSAITPWQSFPQSFLPLFPGGWRELAQREGFELPPEFENAK